MTAWLSRERVLIVPVVLALASGLLTLRCWTRVVPADLVVLPRPGAVYTIEPLGDEDGGATVLTGRPEPVPPTEARLARGTQVRLLRVDQDVLHHPLPRVRVLDGPHAGARGYVPRWRLRHVAASGGLGLRPALLIGVLLSAVAAAISWAVGILVGERQRLRSTAPRQAE